MTNIFFSFVVVVIDAFVVVVAVVVGAVVAAATTTALLLAVLIAFGNVVGRLHVSILRFVHAHVSCACDLTCPSLQLKSTIANALWENNVVLICHRWL